MASNKLIAFAFLVVGLSSVAMATEYIVGDGEGWKVGVNYTLWASGKEFRAGDKLIFQYQPPHNVYKVDSPGFRDCVPSGSALTSGNDTIKLTAGGKKWYICGAADHCSRGQKLVINVVGDVVAPSPQAPAPSASYGIFSSWYQILVAMILNVAVIMV